jgi:hypothetical protein
MRFVLLLVLWLGSPPMAAAADLPPLASPPDGTPTAVRADGRPELMRGFFTQRRTNNLKSAAAGLGAGLLLWGIAARRAGRPEAMRRLRDGLLLALGVVACLAWWNFLRFHYPGHAHPSEFYHYYVGSKYFRELGYTRLYQCAAVADLRAGVLARDSTRRMRDLANNRLETVEAILAQPERCTSHFSPERWRAFQSDVGWIRDRIPPSRWARLQGDHGYNATPVWGILGTVLANTGPLAAGRLLALSLLDPLLLTVMWGFVTWAFGWRVLCVALLYWGTNYTSHFGWTGGAFLRQDWLAASVIGICLMRRGRPAASGFLLATAVLLRIFPVLLLSGIALKAVLEMARSRRLALSAAHRRMVAGGLLALATLVPLSAVTAGGFRAWLDFSDNSRVHLGTPLLNHVGLKTVLSYDHAGRSRLTRDASLDDPVARWKESRQAAFAERQLLFWLLVAGFAALLARASAQAEDWVALALGIGAIPIAAELTGYYHSILLGFGLLWIRRESVGAALCALSALGWGMAEVFQWTDEILTWISLATAVFVTYATAAFCLGTRTPASS